MGAIRLKHSFGISVGVHLLLVLVLLVVAQVRNPVAPRSKNITWIEVEPLAPVSSNRDTAAKQVVRTDLGQESKVAKPDAFLGEKTQTVDEQKVSRTQLGEQRTQSTQTKTARKAEKTSPKTLAPAGGAGSLSQFGIVIPQPGENGEREIEIRREEAGSLTAQAQGEYVKGFKEGERTLLNTREYVFYGYFQRIREKLDRAWDKSLKERLDKYFRRGRQLASETEYVTQLLVTLDSNGQVIRVQTVGASGTRDLDDAAVKAFREAGPFPNPPRGLIESSGHVQVRWDFVLRT